MKLIYTIILLFCLVNIGFSQKPNWNKEQHKDWQKARVNYLKSRDGWLNLAGLFWLEEGNNSFGTSTANTLVFPSNSVDSLAGSFWREGDKVWLTVIDNNLLINNEPINTKTLVFDAANNIVKTITANEFTWVCIKRADKIGIRLRNLANKGEALQQIPTFTFQEKWVVQANFTKTTNEAINISNVIGQITAQTLAGTLSFQIKGKEYRLQALEEDGKLFIIFADKTNRTSTYASGRYLYAKMPAEGNIVWLNFNEAYNPPCAFTNFATCPLPPLQNRLPIAIEAGEKRVTNLGH
ncbi:MAG: DUF1684 domain-containing protein [Chitinophagaceae bacterium]